MPKDTTRDDMLLESLDPNVRSDVTQHVLQENKNSEIGSHTTTAFSHEFINDRMSLLVSDQHRNQESAVVNHHSMPFPGVIATPEIAIQ